MFRTDVQIISEVPMSIPPLEYLQLANKFE